MLQSPWNRSPERLIGTWIEKPDGRPPAERNPVEGNIIELRFSADGEMTFAIRGTGFETEFSLPYTASEGTIAVELPADEGDETRRQEGPFHFTPEGFLVLTYDGKQSTYARQPS